MRRLTLAVLLLLAWGGSARAQVPELRIERAALLPGTAPGQRLVRVYAVPLEPSGAIPTGLGLSSFAVSAEGQTASVVRVQPAVSGSEELAVVLLIDISGSMRGARINAARQAATRFVERLRPGDRVAVITFSDDAVLRLDFTTDRQAVGVALRNVHAGTQETAIYDALNLAGRISWGSRPGRRAIVLLTDGKDTVSSLQSGDIVRLTEKRGVPVHAIAVGDQADTRVLKRLAEMSGGTFNHARDASALGRLYDAVRRRISDGYLVDFAVPEPVSQLRAFQLTWVRPDGRHLTAQGAVQSPGTPGEAAPSAPPTVGQLPGAPAPPSRADPWRGPGLVLALAIVLVAGVAGYFYWRSVRAGQSARAAAFGVMNTGGFGGTSASMGFHSPLGSTAESVMETQPTPNPPLGADEEPETIVKGQDERKALAWLIAIGGPMVGQQFRVFGDQAVIGRGSEADVRIADDGEISRRHAKLFRTEEGDFAIVDMASTNGTLLNGKKVNQARVHDGDLIDLGNTRLVFKSVGEKETENVTH
jgi:VWFA-related protein